MSDLAIERAQRGFFITRSFRDTADRDYISARILHRYRLTEQFMWMSLQAIEKYLKAILLFHDLPTKHLNHNICIALAEAKAINRLGMRISERASKFVSYINEQGPNRYFTFPRYAEGDELFHLDHTVLQIRRFCHDFFFPHDDDVLCDDEAAKLKYSQSDEIFKNRARFRLDKNGFLEIVLDTTKHPDLRPALVWRNFNFGSRNRHRITYRHWKTWTQSSNFIHPEIVDWAIKKVKLPGVVVDEMRKRIRTRQ